MMRVGGVSWPVAIPRSHWVDSLVFIWVRFCRASVARMAKCMS